MPLQSCYRSGMELTQDISKEFSDLCKYDHGGALASDEATAVIAVMSAVVISVMNRADNVRVIHQLVKSLKPFLCRRVLGSDIIHKGKILFRDTRVKVDDQEREARNQLNNQLACYGSYIFRLDSAIQETGQRTAKEQTTENVRTAFLRRLSFDSWSSAQEYDLAADFGIDFAIG